MSVAALPDGAITLEDLREAAEALAGIAERTPLIEAPLLSERLGVLVRLKCEQFQPMGAFKMRGAYTAVARLAPDRRDVGVITHSSGNHGQAVAYAARAFGIRAVIVMPAGAAETKVAGVRRFGGEVVFVQDPADREPTARGIAERDNLTLIPPYEYRDVILGQGTCGLEILEDAPDTATILAPIGGGGLLAGIAAAVRAVRPATRLIGVEPETAAKLTAALSAGGPAPIERGRSIADGLLPVSVGTLPYRFLRPVVREAIQVSESEIGEAVRFLYRCMGLRVEPSGAVPVAAVLAGRAPAAGPVVLVLSGGNVDADLFARLVS